jgi:hypothetical protein
MPKPTLDPVRDYVRVFARAKCDRRLTISFQSSRKTVTVHGSCTNVGIGGFSARVPHQLDRDQMVSIEFWLHDIPISLQATVRHSNGFDAGFQFIAPGDDERRAIAKFFMEGLSRTD